MLVSHQVQVQQPPGMSVLRRFRLREARTAPPTVPSSPPPPAGTGHGRLSHAPVLHGRLRLIAVRSLAHQARVPTDPLLQRRGLDGLVHGTTTKRIGPGLSGEPRQVLNACYTPACRQKSHPRTAGACGSRPAAGLWLSSRNLPHILAPRGRVRPSASASRARDQGLTSQPRFPLPLDVFQVTPPIFGATWPGLSVELKHYHSPQPHRRRRHAERRPEKEMGRSGQTFDELALPTLGATDFCAEVGQHKRCAILCQRPKSVHNVFVKSLCAMATALTDAARRQVSQSRTQGCSPERRRPALSATYPRDIALRVPLLGADPVQCPFKRKRLHDHV